MYLPLRWLLIFDSEGISEHWLKTLHGKNEVITISYYSAALKNTLESALSDGNRSYSTSFVFDL